MRPSFSRPSTLGLAGLALAAALATLPAHAGAAGGAGAEAALANLVRLAAAEQPGAGSAARQGTSAAEPETGRDGGRDPEPEAAPGAASAAPPLVYWYDAPCAADAYRPGLSSRLEAARRGLDDSDRFPPAPPLDWRYDPQTGQYFYREDGRWVPSGRSSGWYDRSGTWHPDPSWYDGRYRPERDRYSHRYYRYGAVPRPLRPRDPCPCEDW